MDAFNRAWRGASVVVLGALTLQGCGGDDYKDPPEPPAPMTMVQQQVNAAAGGTVNLRNGVAVLTIPANALSANTMVTIEEMQLLSNSPALPANTYGMSPRSCCVDSPISVAQSTMVLSSRVRSPSL